jgi:integrase
VIGVTELTRATKQVYRIAFSYKGVQCREIIALEHSKANLAYCERQRAKIIMLIEKGEFNYGKEFPRSKRAKVFGEGLGKDALLKDLLEAYRDRVKKTFEPSTYAGTKTAIDNVLVPRFGHMRISALKRSDIREWVSLQTTSLKRIKNVLLPLNAVLNEALGDNIIEANPLTGMKIGKLLPVAQRTTNFDPQPYGEPEVKRLLANVPAPERWAFQLWAYTGLRTGELIG